METSDPNVKMDLIEFRLLGGVVSGSRDSAGSENAVEGCRMGRSSRTQANPGRCRPLAQAKWPRRRQCSSGRGRRVGYENGCGVLDCWLPSRTDLSVFESPRIFQSSGAASRVDAQTSFLTDEWLGRSLPSE